jgi:predicted DNA-binding transcriptional regulator AlpA
MAKKSADFMWLEEVLDEFGMSRSSFAKLRAEGRGPVGRRIGRQVMFRRAEVEAWFDQQVAV